MCLKGNLMKIDLTGKRALVCGSSDGIGKSIAIGLAEAGAEVVLLARNESKLQAVKNELNTDAGQQHQYLIADFSDTEAVRKAAHQAAENPIHILVNNTGGPPGGPLIEASVEAILSAYNAHLINNHNITQALVPGMKAAGYGRIINIISTSVKIPLKGLGVSNTTRGAVANWAKTLSFELGPDGITVNNVLPGATKTGRLSSIIQNKAGKLGKAENEIEAAMLKEIPMNRFAAPEEVANAAIFFASEQAGYITGTSIPVDGGRTGSI